MTPDPKTGLVAVVDRGGKDTPTIRMFPVDAKEAFVRGGVLKSDNAPRFVLAESYVAPTTA